MSAPEASPTVEVVRFEDPARLPGESPGRGPVSDRTEGEAIRFHADEVLFSEGVLVGKTREQLRSLHFRRDRDWLQP